MTNQQLHDLDLTIQGQQSADAYITVSIQGEASRDVLLDATDVSIGRVAGNDIVVPDPAVSREHARIERRGEGFWFVDLGSSNGSQLNGEACSTSVLRPGDRVMIGGAILCFHSTRAPDEGRASGGGLEDLRAGLTSLVSWAARSKDLRGLRRREKELEQSEGQILVDLGVQAVREADEVLSGELEVPAAALRAALEQHDQTLARAEQRRQDLDAAHQRLGPAIAQADAMLSAARAGTAGLDVAVAERAVADARRAAAAEVTPLQHDLATDEAQLPGLGQAVAAAARELGTLLAAGSIGATALASTLETLAQARSERGRHRAEDRRARVMEAGAPLRSRWRLASVGGVAASLLLLMALAFRGAFASGPQEPDLAHAAQRTAMFVVTLKRHRDDALVVLGNGTCFAHPESGYLVTNAHNIRTPRENLPNHMRFGHELTFFVLFGPEECYPAEIVHVSDEHDMAVVHVAEGHWEDARSGWPAFEFAPLDSCGTGDAGLANGVSRGRLYGQRTGAAGQSALAAGLLPA